MEEICEQAEVSKVTFFKFFPMKEDVLIYFMNVWLLQRMLHIAKEGLKGAAAIRHVFRAAAEGSKQAPGLMLSLIAFLAESSMHPCMPELTDEEFLLLFGDDAEQAKAMEVNIFTLFERLIEEAKAAGECRRKEPPALQAQWLTTTFYGAFLTAHMCKQDVWAVYEDHLALFFAEEGRALGDGEHCGGAANRRI